LAWKAVPLGSTVMVKEEALAVIELGILEGVDTWSPRFCPQTNPLLAPCPRAFAVPAF
jgi:hypothetical protein